MHIALMAAPHPPCLHTCTSHHTWFLPICQNQIQKLFKNFQGPYKGYKGELNSIKPVLL